LEPAGHQAVYYDWTMRKPANILLLVVIAALLPLRSIAAVMVGACAAGPEQIARPRNR